MHFFLFAGFLAWPVIYRAHNLHHTCEVFFHLLASDLWLLWTGKKPTVRVRNDYDYWPKQTIEPAPAHYYTIITVTLFLRPSLYSLLLMRSRRGIYWAQKIYLAAWPKLCALVITTYITKKKDYIRRYTVYNDYYFFGWIGCVKQLMLLPYVARDVCLCAREQCRCCMCVVCVVN